MSQPARIAYIDALRGFAAAYVVLHHMYLGVWFSPGAAAPAGWAQALVPLTFGRAGVDLFLVISGFVLYHPVASGQRGLEAYGRFLLRRAWRIVPPYWAAIAATLAAVLAFPALRAYLPGTDPIRWEVVLSHLALVHNLAGEAHVHAFAPPWWTIPMEYQLYMAFPLLAIAIARLGVLPVAAGAAIATVAARWGLGWWAVHGGGENLWVNSIPGYLGLFAAGMLAAAWTHAGAWRHPRLWTAAAVGLAGAGVLAWYTKGFYLAGDLLWGLASAALILACRDAHGWLAHPALQRLGAFSYSTYLVHFPLLAGMLVALGALGLGQGASFALLVGLGLPLTWAISYGFHVLCERPFLRTPGFLRSAPAPAALRDAA